MMFFSAFPCACFCRMVEYSLDLQNINLSAIRTVRVLRPLKAINRVPSENTQRFLLPAVYLFYSKVLGGWADYFCASTCLSVHIKHKCSRMKIYVCIQHNISGSFVQPHATCSPRGLLNIHLMLSHTARSGPWITALSDLQPLMPLHWSVRDRNPVPLIRSAVIGQTFLLLLIIPLFCCPNRQLLIVLSTN